MEFNLENPVVKLCAEGMSAEAQGKIDNAKELFQEAWNIASDNFEKFTAAHYLARNQNDSKVELEWNLASLNYAMMIPDETKNATLPSLYLNIGKSYEKLGDLDSARMNYQSAFLYSGDLPQNGYGDMLRSGINAALTRVGAAGFKNEALDQLINNWCERKELRPLSLVLPAYLGNMGDEQGINKLISAMSFLSATRCLNLEDQEKIDILIAKLAKT